MKRYCFTLDLKDDERLIAEYERYHQAVWPDIEASLRASGIVVLEIYRYATRMFLIMETTDDFSPERKAQADAANPRVQEWERLMWAYQQALPGAKPGEKWLAMERIYRLSD